jgi:hypothetical protein
LKRVDLPTLGRPTRAMTGSMVALNLETVVDRFVQDLSC